MGAKAARYLSEISGMGSYRVNKNSIMDGSVPQFAGSKSTRVRHREFITNISGSTAFNIQEFDLNPGLVATFPWCSTLANLFQEVIWHGAVLEFVSTSADALNSTNTALGTVILATQYNPYAPAFTDKVSMENTEFVNSIKPSCSVIHPIECDPKLTPLRQLFIRNDTTPPGDIRFYDLGTFSIATVGMQASAVIGELWISYDLEFLKPIYSTVNNGGLGWHVDNASYDSANPFGIAQNVGTGNIDCSIGISGTGYDTLFFPPSYTSGYFIVAILWHGTANNQTLNLPSTTYKVCSAGPNFLALESSPESNNTGLTWNTDGVGAVKLYKLFCVKVTGVNSAVQLGAFTIPNTTADYLSVSVLQVDSDFFASLASLPLSTFQEETELKEALEYVSCG